MYGSPVSTSVTPAETAPRASTLTSIRILPSAIRKERQNPPSPSAANPRAGREAGRTRLNANMRVMNLSLIVTVCAPCIFGDAPSTKLAQTAKTCKPLHEKALVPFTKKRSDRFMKSAAIFNRICAAPWLSPPHACLRQRLKMFAKHENRCVFANS